MPRVLYTTINSGQKVSGDIDLSKFAPGAIGFPALTSPESSDYFLQGNFDTTSANFMRLMEARTPNSGDFRMAVGVGSRMYPMPTIFAYPAFARLEAAVAVADVRTFTILARTLGVY